MGMRERSGGHRPGYRHGSGGSADGCKQFRSQRAAFIKACHARARLPSMKTEDPYDLQRFVAAEDAGGTYERAAAELRRGRKTATGCGSSFRR